MLVDFLCIYVELQRCAYRFFDPCIYIQCLIYIVTDIYLFANSTEQEVSKPVEAEAGEASTETKEAAPST